MNKVRECNEYCFNFLVPWGGKGEKERLRGVLDFVLMWFRPKC